MLYLSIKMKDWKMGFGQCSNPATIKILNLGLKLHSRRLFEIYIYLSLKIVFRV